MSTFRRLAAHPVRAVPAAVLSLFLVLIAGLSSARAAGNPAPVCPADADAAPIELPYAAFFKRPIGPLGLEFSDTLRRAAGCTVRLVGYMVQDEQARAGSFRLSPRPLQLSSHADGPADDLPPGTVTVLLDAAQRERVVAHQGGALALVGRLELGRQEQADGQVSWLRLQLPPTALAAQASAPAELHPSPASIVSLPHQ